jgi:nitrate/nitrite transporter NarK
MPFTRETRLHYAWIILTAAGVLGTIASVSIVSRFAFSVLTERLGGRAVLTMAVLGQSTSVLMLLFANDA